MDFDQSDIKKVSLLTQGKAEEQEKKLIFNMFRTQDLEYLIQNEIRPTVIQVIMKEDEKMMKRLRIYSERYNIPIIDYSSGEINLKDARIKRESNKEEEWYSLDLTSCNIEPYQLDLSELDGLLSITFPSNLEIIPDNCLFGCSSLTRVYLPENLVSIGNGCFFGCEALKNIWIPEKIKELGENTFGQCTSLVKLSFESENPSQIRKLGKYCFANCYSLQEIDLQGRIKEIPEYCFINCIHLTKVKLSKVTTKLENYSFKNCGIQQLEIPLKVEFLGEETFAYCKNLEKLHWGYEMKKIISKKCFYKSGIKEVWMKEPVDYIGDEAFAYCEDLKQVEIAEGCKYGKNVFKGSPVKEPKEINDENESIKDSEKSYIKTGDELVHERILALIDDSSFTKIGFPKRTNLETLEKRNEEIQKGVQDLQETIRQLDTIKSIEIPDIYLPNKEETRNRSESIVKKEPEEEYKEKDINLMEEFKNFLQKDNPDEQEIERIEKLYNSVIEQDKEEKQKENFFFDIEPKKVEEKQEENSFSFFDIKQEQPKAQSTTIFGYSPKPEKPNFGLQTSSFGIVNTNTSTNTNTNINMNTNIITSTSTNSMSNSFGFNFSIDTNSSFNPLSGFVQKRETTTDTNQNVSSDILKSSNVNTYTNTFSVQDTEENQDTVRFVPLVPKKKPTDMASYIPF